MSIQINLNVIGTPIDIPSLKVDTEATVHQATIDGQRAIFVLPDTTPPHGFTVAWINQTARSIVPTTSGSYEGSMLTPPLPDLVYTPPTPPVPSGLRIEGDHFMYGSERWLWKGSTEFRLPERVLAGVDITPILTDRTDAGANLVRMLAMKANNTGYELNPRSPGYWEAVIETCERVGLAGMFGEWVIFADTKRMMPDPVEQQDFYRQTVETIRQYPWMMVELLNEDKHPTQAINAQGFRKPDGVLSSHGSGLSDVQPVKPLWDFGTYHARRSGGLAKIGSNYSPYVFQDTYPTPCPYVPEETIKPEQYGYDAGVARLMGQSACCGAGGTGHHSAWLDERLFNDGERACMTAFYRALS
jgi:hypothetical protein